jgi:hypothetical protein
MRSLTFNSLDIKRVIIHKILEKKKEDACSLVEETNAIIECTPRMKVMIIERLLDAMGRKGKGFYLEVGDISSDSYFVLCNDLLRKKDPEFISVSKTLATKLAGLQTKGEIPNSYLMFIEAIDRTYHDTPIYITIKAEPHSAFKQTGDMVELMENLFLSPSQKLYKVGILYEDSNEEKAFPNDNHSGYVFDEQFTGTSNLAKYFYEGYLGFTLLHNGPIQSKKFYDLTSALIMNKAPMEDRDDLLDALKTVFKADVSIWIRPNEFVDNYIGDATLKALFIAKVVNKLPASILKSSELLDFSLQNRKVSFGAFSISGPDAEFAEKVRVIKSRAELDEIDFNNPNQTVVVMPGRPHLNKPKKPKPDGLRRAGTPS